MKFLSIVKKEILHNLKDKKAMFLMTIFPIILILILGTALSGSFESSTVISKAKVAYIGENKGEIYNSFKSFTETIGNKLNIEFIEVSDKQKAIEDVSNGVYDSFISIKNEESIEFYSNNIRKFNSNLIKTVMKNFVDKSNLIIETMKISPENVKEVVSEKEKNYVSIKSIEQKTGPSAKDYYAVTMFTMIILYSTNIGGFAIITEKMRRTYQRIMCSNVSKKQYLFAKVTGAFIVTSFQVSLVYLFSRYVIKTNWGDMPQYILLVAASLIFMSVSLGIGLSSGIRNPAIMAAALNMTIPIFVFLAGGYIPLSVFGSKTLMVISNISPLKWTNEAIFKIIYDNDISTLPIAILVNLGIGLVFISISLINTSGKDVI